MQIQVDLLNLSLGCLSAIVVLAHVKLCGRCTQSKELLKHHQKCTSESCPVCGPVKEHVRKQKMTAAIRSQQLNAHRASMGQQPLVGQHQATLGAAHLSGHPHQMSHLPPGRTSGAPGLTPSGSRPLQVTHCPKCMAAVRVKAICTLRRYGLPCNHYRCSPSGVLSANV